MSLTASLLAGWGADVTAARDRELGASTERWATPFRKLRVRSDTFNVSNCKGPDIKLPLATELQA